MGMTLNHSSIIPETVSGKKSEEGRQSATQRMEKPSVLFIEGTTEEEADAEPRLLGLTVLSDPEHQKYPFCPNSINSPAGVRFPPGRPLNPELFVAPVFGFTHRLVDFNFPPAIALPPKKFSSCVHSASLGTCQPAGHIFPASRTAY
jgi:hypothetical protein